MKTLLLLVLVDLLLCMRFHHHSSHGFLSSSKKKKIDNPESDYKYNLKVTQDSKDELTIRLASLNFPFFEMPHRYPFAYSKQNKTEQPQEESEYRVEMNDRS